VLALSLEFQYRESNDLKGKGREIVDSQINTPRPNDLLGDCDPALFAFKPYQLAQILDPKDLSLLDALGGIDGLLTGLSTHKSRGLNNPLRAFIYLKSISPPS
jgi:hypothetical protein